MLVGLGPDLVTFFEPVIDHKLCDCRTHLASTELQDDNAEGIVVVPVAFAQNDRCVLNQYSFDEVVKKSIHSPGHQNFSY